MKQKIKCKKCGLLIDSDLPFCPYCGYKQDYKEKVVANIEEDNNKVIEKKIEKDKFFDFPSRTLDVSLTTSIIAFVVGLFGLQFIQLFFVLVSKALPNLGFINSSLEFSAAINFACYFVLFGIFLILLNNDITKITKTFAKGETYLLGIGFGFLMMLVSGTVLATMHLISPQGPNLNEQSVNAVTSAFPVLSVIVFGFIGPICEEFTYRLGLFNGLKKINRFLAYFGTALVFGFIHFNFGAFGTPAFIGELINIPSYIVSGLLLCYFYEYAGIGASILAHITNNFVAVIVQIILLG